MQIEHKASVYAHRRSATSTALFRCLQIEQLACSVKVECRRRTWSYGTPQLHFLLSSQAQFVDNSNPNQ